MSIITLTTDYGLKDHFVGAMKGTILSQLPDVSIVDISHSIDPFNTFEASYIINAAYSRFPKGTVHLIGVDVERNKENQHVALQWNDHFFIAADNGILSLLVQKSSPQQLVQVNIHDRFLSDTSDMEVLINVACLLAKGGKLNVIGKEINSLKVVSELRPIVAPDLKSIKGFVIYIDHFGNIVTNITKQLFIEIGRERPYEIVLNEKVKQNKKGTLKTICSRYSAIGNESEYELKNYEGEKLALFNEAGLLEIAIFRSNPDRVGSAKTLLGLDYRDAITIQFL